MIDIEKIKQAALEYREAGKPVQMQSSAVLELIERLENYTENCERYKELYLSKDTELTELVTRLEAAERAIEEKQYEICRKEDVILSLQEKLEAAEHDVARYRWLRTNPDWETYRLGTPIVFVTCNEEAVPAQEGELDIAVDAAMKESK